jgi:ATP-dependent DNA helicase RecG
MPSTIEKLQKFFRLESERGYDNRAVVGGLKKILPIWETEASNEKINEDIIRLVKNRIDEYADHTSQERQEIIQSLLELISQTRPNPQSPTLKPQIERLVENPLYSNRDTFSHTPNKNEGNNQRPQRKQRETGTWISGPSNTPGLDAPLTVLQGVGPKTAQSLAVLGLKTLGDLLYYFPRRYDDYSQLTSINRLKYGDELTVLGTIQSISTRAVRGRQVQITEAILGDGTGFLRLTWFNQPWLDHQLQNGKSIVVSGKVEMYLGRLGMNSPDWEPLEQEHLHTNRIVPVYPLTEHITQRWLRKTMYQVVNFWAPRIPDYLPSFIRVGASLVDLPTALFQAHFPDSQERLAAARSRLAFDEIFFLQLGVLQQKRNWESLPGQIYPSPEDWYQAQLNRLPYTLTNSQINVLTDLRKDLISGHPMNRLLQGDVGSGKTIVAFLAAAIVTSHNAQVAIMAPTSILAEQHYRNICRYMVSTEDDASAHLQIDQVKLLIGDTPEKEKNEILSGLNDGSIRLVIGTHALIEDPISFQNLQLIVVDEQHRFGVAQRTIRICL